MKTNFVKKGSEKNIEMFEMTNEELVTVNGGGEFVAVKDEDGNIVIIYVNKNKGEYYSSNAKS